MAVVFDFKAIAGSLNNPGKKFVRLASDAKYDSYHFEFTLTADSVLLRPVNDYDGCPLYWGITQDKVGGHKLAFDSGFHLLSPADFNYKPEGRFLVFGHRRGERYEVRMTKIGN